MWVRKSTIELLLEKNERKVKAKYIYLLLMALSLYWIFYNISGMGDLVALFEQDPEKLGMMLLLPVFIFVGHRSYVNHGGFGWVSERVCLGCGNTWYHSHDGWGFLSFGKDRPKWYQFKACRTPDKCEIVGKHRVKWVSEEFGNL